MNWVRYVRGRLAWRLFLSYMVIVTVGVLVLASATALSAPVALERHLNEMQGLAGADPTMAADLRASFTQAVYEILAVAASAAVVAAIAVSTFTARRIVGPIQATVRASQRIAGGDYGERVPVTGQDELGMLTASFNQMAETLERTEARRMELIGNVAHELRTPLSGIRTITEGLVDGVLPAGPETFRQVEREVARLQRLVQDLEELSRAEAGQIPLERRPVDPVDLVQGAVERLQPQYADKGVTLDTDLAQGLPRVQADPARATQVLLNLLGNALQYTPAGGRVTAGARANGPEVLFWVRDTGIGVADEHLPHLFERFYRVDKSRARTGGGSGIGLTIARHLVEAHGGHILAASPGPGRGSTFTFSLPTAT